jgi:hypothetical protein
MRYFLLIAAMMCVGCSNDAEETPPSNMTSVGSVYHYDVTYRDSNFTRTDSVTRGPFSFEGKRYVFQVGADEFDPLYAFDHNGNISRYSYGLTSGWFDMSFGTRETRSYRDSTFFENYWVIEEYVGQYRDTLLEVNGQLLAGVKEQRNTNYRTFRLDGSISDRRGYEEYDVWIPSIGYYGLMVSDPGTPSAYIARLKSYSFLGEG